MSRDEVSLVGQISIYPITWRQWSGVLKYVQLNKSCVHWVYSSNENQPVTRLATFFQPDRMKGLEIMSKLKPQILILRKISTISVNIEAFILG